MSQIIIYDHEDSTRIDKFLSQEMGISRNLLQRVRDEGEVKVNGKEVKKSCELNAGDKIECDVDLSRWTTQEVFPDSSKIELDVIKQHDDYIVLYKPKGVPSHPKNLRDLGLPSVASFLYHKYGMLDSVGPFVRAGIVHRLDKDTDGLMICVLSERGLKYFRTLFDNRSDVSSLGLGSTNYHPTDDAYIQKYYRALCNMTPAGYNKIRGLKLPYFINKIVIPKIPQKNKIHKLGVTEILGYSYDLDQTKFDGYGYDRLASLDIKIWTGRTHQIRYHLSTIGLPIVGDYLYNNLYKKPQQLQLTAYRLRFVDPDGQLVDIII